MVLLANGEGARDRALAAAMFAYGAHVTRNVTSAYYVFLAGALLYGLAAAKKTTSRELNTVGRILVLFGVCSIYVLFASFGVVSSGELSVGAARLFFVLPSAVIGWMLVDSPKDLGGAFNVFVFLCCIGALSMAYQLLTGTPIPWFAEAAERGGQVRFASSLGSLTAYGGLVGVAAFLVLRSRLALLSRTIVLSILCLGAVLSLQKASIVSLVLGFGVSVVLGYRVGNGGAALRMLAPGVLVVALLGLALGALPDAMAYFEVAAALAGSSDVDAVVYDTSIGSGVVERLLDLPAVLFHEYGFSGVLFGVGVRGMGGVLGIPDSPMAHNQFGDLLFAGGLLYVFVFLLMLGALAISFARAWVGSLSNKMPDADRDSTISAFGCVLLLVANMPVASGVLFQPVSGCLFWLIVGGYSRIHSGVRV